MAILDLARRQAVMERSQRLGHCICNPAHPCPCPSLINANVCPCAGERPITKIENIALTRHVRKAGCASKIGQADLLQILGRLPEISDPRVIVGAAAGDDAGVFRLDERRALVQTVDVFTPCVDDPYLFGRIAAANSLSDVYAMGGTPLTALSIVGFPIDELDGGILEEMLRGGMDTLEEAGCVLLGGHSINDPEIKCGFAITGLIAADAAVERDRARPGDLLILTKPLGTGIIAFAAQLGLVSRECLEEAGAWMATLNKDAAELMVKYEAHACTDITGFGLAGHLVSMVRGSGVDAELDLSTVPVFGAVPECIAREVYSGAVDRNQAYSMAFVKVLPVNGNGDPGGLPVLYDPQTSGGLLIALPEREGKAFLMEMWERGHHAASAVGRIVARPPERSASEIRVVNTHLNRLIGMQGATAMNSDSSPAVAGTASPAGESCCESPPAEATAAMPSQDGLAAFRGFLKEVNRPGLIDARNKKLMAIALAIALHCAPCLKIHLEAAQKMGIPSQEVDEAANLAIAFGGCTAMMFYQEVCQQVGYPHP